MCTTLSSSGPAATAETWLVLLVAALLSVGVTETSTAQPVPAPNGAHSQASVAPPSIGPKQWLDLARFRLSPDGKWLAYGWSVKGEPKENRGAVVVQQVDGAVRQVIETTRGEALFSANSNSVLIETGGAGGMTATIYDLSTWESKAVFRNPDRVEISHSQPDFALFHGCSEFVTPAGETIRPEDDELVAYAIDDHRLTRYQNVRSFVPSEDHQTFAYVTETSPHGWELVVVDHASGDRVLIGKGSGRCTSLAWGGDNQSLAYLHSEQGAVKALVLWAGVGERRPIRQVLRPNRIPGWPKGRTLRDSTQLHVMAKGRFIGF